MLVEFSRAAQRIDYDLGMQIDVVIFDCDGVLIDSEPVANRVWGELIRGLGWTLGPEESMRLFIGHTMPECLRIVEERLGRPVPAGLLDTYHERLCAAYETELRTVPGVETVLRRLAKPCCVASNGDHEKIQAGLKRAGLLAAFDGRIFSAADVPRPKPFPDVYLAAARAMNATPARCVVIEDSLTGVTAALTAGMRVYAYVPHGDGSEHSRCGASVFRRMEDLFTLLPADVFYKEVAA